MDDLKEKPRSEIVEIIREIEIDGLFGTTFTEIAEEIATVGSSNMDLTRVGGLSFTFEAIEINHAENMSTIPTEIQRPDRRAYPKREKIAAV